MSNEIHCTHCDADTLVRREPVFEGFKKTGERFICTACGHVYETEAAVPFKQARKSTVFTDADRPERVRVFRDEERGGTCRLCRHYVVNPFTQRCGLHHREVEATDTCPDFEGAEQQDGQ